ncbi:MAG: NAD(P)/FAD-dependent oxidoreductase [Chloroflexaceae bacterium]|nr:NAD(P)/FAD-dependent oxidoreductase [Chloroflexaceae bacterium]
MATDTQHVVIVGGGFGGLYAANALGNVPDVHVTLIDKRNFHLFQPLLYQVATGGLSASDIAYPLRTALQRYRNVQVLYAEVNDILPDQQLVLTSAGPFSYDTVIVATGVSHHYFGNDQWEQDAPGLKTLEDAIEMRHRIFHAFEAAEVTTDPAERQAWMTFVVVGGGPTGVELAGALGELAHNTLRREYRAIDTADAQILLVEGTERVLPPYPKDLSAAAASELYKLGVTVRTGTFVTDIAGERVTLKTGDAVEQIHAKTVLWAAGMRASVMGEVIRDRLGAELDRAGRVQVQPDTSVPNYPNVFVIGDLAHFAGPAGTPLPGVAQVAMQQGEYVARLIRAQMQGKQLPAFRYQDRGSLAVIGRHAAVADLGRLHFGGFFAWLIWLFVHIAYLVGFDRKLLVIVQWGWSYLTRKHGSRLILNAEYMRDIPDTVTSTAKQNGSHSDDRTQVAGGTR